MRVSFVPDFATNPKCKVAQGDSIRTVAITKECQDEADTVAHFVGSHHEAANLDDLLAGVAKFPDAIPHLLDYLKSL